MNKIALTALSIAGVFALGACNQSPQEAAGDVAEQEMLSKEDNLQEQADLAGATGNEAKEEALDDRADAMGDAADDAEDAAEALTAPAGQ